jgi:hypothetical protein
MGTILMTPAGPPPTIAARPPRPLDVRTTEPPPGKRWLERWTGHESSGFLTSLLLHIAILLALAIPIVDEVRPGAPLALFVSQAARDEAVEFELIDTELRGRSRTDEPAPGPPLVSVPLPRFTESVRQVLTKPSEGGSGGEGLGVASTDGGAGTGLPKHAVQQGNFAAWWVPKIERYGEKVEPGQLPRVGQDYNIYVQVRLPADRKSFRIEDLSGEIVGTDGYKQLIPDRAWVVDEQGELTRAAGKPLLRVTQGVVQIVFKVQGAGKAGVRDTIRIKSRLLNEEQTLVLVFQPME